MLSCEQFILELDKKCKSDYYRYRKEDREKIYSVAKKVMDCFYFPRKKDGGYFFTLNVEGLLNVISDNKSVFDSCKELLNYSYLIFEDSVLDKNWGTQTAREQYVSSLQFFSDRFMP